MIGSVSPPEPSEPLLSIIAPCRNEVAHIEGALRSILHQRLDDGEFEVIVADGMSDDGTRDVLDRLVREYPQLRVIDNPGRIVSTGLNAAIRAAKGRVLMRMDCHATYEPDYVRACLAVLRQSGADNVGGAWRAEGRGLISKAVAAASYSRFALGGGRTHDIEFEGACDTVCFGCWDRSLFDRVGLFDEELVRNQDDEHNLRIVRAGGRVWQSPRIRFHYIPRNSLRALWLQYVQYGYWKVRVIQKHRLPASLRHLVPGAFVATVGGLTLLAPISPFAGALLASVLAAYGAMVTVAALAVAREHGWELLPVLPAVFATYHVGYGYGFLRGLGDFVIRRRGADPRFSRLSRPAR